MQKVYIKILVMYMRLQWQMLDIVLARAMSFLVLKAYIKD